MPAIANRIVIGDLASPLFEFENDAIVAGTARGTFAVDVIGDQLSVDVFEPTVRVSVASPTAMSGIPYGTPVRWYCGGNLVCKQYLNRPERVGKFFWKLRCMSAIGLLDDQIHAGGLYSGATVASVLAEIMGDQTYTVDADVASMAVYGWLPYDTARNNLHQLLFAMGVACKRNTDGDPRFTLLSASSPVSVPDSRVGYGGSITYETPASGVDVIEHIFIKDSSAQSEIVYDNTSDGIAADHQLVQFSSAPVYDLTADGLTIHESGVNYAIVSGIGSITATPYRHIQQMISRRVQTNQRPNVKRVENMTLVNTLNGDNIADRVMAYYSTARMVSGRMVLDNERTGDVLQMSDPFGDSMTAFLQSASVNASTNLVADCIFIDGYTPTGQGNRYNTATVFSGSATITVPEGGGRITLISGGAGGHGGENGEYGEDIAGAYYGEGGEGGASGTPGRGGRIISTILPAGEYQLVSGAGGAGGAQGADGADGTDTELYQNGTLILTTSGAARPLNGFVDLISGILYAAQGEEGIAGGKGGKPSLTADPGYSAGSVSYGGQTWAGGTNGNQYISADNTTITSGGGGGGAAVGSNGAAGGNGTSNQIYGGGGGSAIAAEDATTIGQGGQGGHGGGGGGASGAKSVNGQITADASPGAGGVGGAGGAGGPGGAVLYTYV